MPGSGAVLIGPYPPDIVAGDQFAKFVPGERYRVGALEYMYAKFSNGAADVASVAGGAAYWSDRANGTVTSDKTGSQQGASNPSGCAGVFQGAVTDGYFCWLVVKGPYTVSLASGDSNGAVGNRIFPPAADTDLTFRSEADSSVSSSEIPAQTVGRQLAAGASNAALVDLDITV